MELFNKTILKQIGTRILKKKETISVAESVTAGLLQFGFSSIPDASRFFQGGLTTYNLGQKFKHLQVEPIHALAVNCVSKQVATEMAIHVCELFSSHWGIGITGYASPAPESANKVFSFYSICYRKKIRASGKLTASQADPPEIQLKFANVVLEKLAGLL